MRTPAQKAPIWIEQSPSAETAPKSSPDAIVRAAYRKYGRGKNFQKAVRMGLADKSVPKFNATEGRKP
jgi:hypothetical protein